MESKMTELNYALSPMSDVYDYLNEYYGDYDSFEAALLDSIDNNSDLTSIEKAEASQSLTNKMPWVGMWGENEVTSITQAMADAAIAGGGVYLNENLSHYYSNVGQTIKATRLPGQSLGVMLETALVELGQPANQNFGKVGLMGKVFGPFGAALALGLAIDKIYDTYNSGGDWQGEAVKQAVINSTAIGVGTLVGTMIGGPVGAVAGALIGAAISYEMDQHWSDITSFAENAIDLGQSVAQAIEGAQIALGDDISEIMNDASSAIDNAIDFGQNLIHNFTDWMPNLGDIAALLPPLPFPLPDNQASPLSHPL
jgi:gas vesicle protein